MSGVIIDVDTKAEGSKRDLASLNNSLARMFSGATKAKGALNGLGDNKLAGATRDLNKANASVTSFGSNGTRALDSIARSTTGLTRDLGLLKGAVVGAGLAFTAMASVDAFNKIGDDLVNVQNRLKLVTQDTYKLMASQRSLLRLSNDTRSGLQGSTALYQAFSLSMEKANVSQERLLRGTKTLQQAGQLGGTGVEAVSLAITQLNQGLSSGTLRGEELNSVLEQMPYLGRGIAQELKMTTGQLRDFAAQGKLTTEVVFKAIEGMESRTDAAFRRSAATVAQGRAAWKQSLTYNIADLNQYLGVSAGFAAALMKNAVSMEGASDRIISTLSLVRSSLSGYVNEVNNSKPLSAVLKAALRFEFSPLSAGDKLNEAKKVKGFLKDFQDLINKDNAEIQVKATPNNLQRLLGRVRSPRATADDGDDLPNITTMRERVEEVVKLGAGLYGALQVTAENTLHLLPKVRLPLNSFADDLKEFIKSADVDVGTWVANTLRPATRGIESLNEVMSGFATGDKRVERAWVNLFKSDSLVEFNENLFKLNKAREYLKLDDKGLFGSAFLYRIDRSTDKTEDFLKKLGLAENTFKVNVPVDEITMRLRTVGTVAKRVYEDLLAPKLDPMFRKLAVQTKILGDTMVEGLARTFTVNGGDRIGNVLGRGIVDGLQGVFNSWEGLENLTLGDALREAVARMGDSIRAPLQHLGDFVKGFFRGLFDSFDVSANPLRKMFDGIQRDTEKSLGWVEDRISGFRDAVNGFFYDIWDKVVGHSYWPDMVDGVVDYTKKLFGAEDGIDGFAASVSRKFKDLYANILNMAKDAGGMVGIFASKLAEVDWGDALKVLTGSIGSAIAAGVLLAFGSFKMKAAALSYFISLFDVALGGVFTAIAPSVGVLAGTIGGEFGEKFIGGLVRTLNTAIVAIPAFIESFLSAVVPIPGLVAGLFNFFPVLSSDLAVSLLALGGAYAIFAKNGKKTIGEILFGKGTKGLDGKMGPKTGGIAPMVKAMTLDWIPEVVGLVSPTLGRALGNVKLGGVFSVFKNNFAIAGAVALGSAMLDSVSLFSAAQIGIPLLGLALLGPDGGLRFVKEFGGFFFNLTKTAVNMAGTAILTAVPRNNVLADLFYSAIVWRGQKRDKRQEGEVASTFGTLLSSLASIPGNLVKNGKAYGAGEVNFVEAMLISQLGGVDDAGGLIREKMIPLRDQFRAAVESVMTFGGGAKNNVRSTLKTMVSNFDADFKRMGGHFKKASAEARKFGAGIAASLAVAGASAKGSLGLIVDGLLFLGRALGGRVLLFTAFFTFAATSAKAATSAGGAINELTGNIAALAATLLTATVALKGFGVASNALKAFNAGKLAFSEMNGPGAKGATSAGLAASSAYLVDLAKGLGQSFKSVGTGGAAQMKVAGAAIGELVAGVQAGGSALGALGKGFGKLGAFAAQGLRAVAASAIAAVAPFVGVIATVSAVVAGVGLLGVALFGKGNTFFDRLEYTYDKIRSILGMEASTDQGRRSKVQDALKTTEIDGIKLDFTAAIERTDFDNMSSEMFASVSEQATETGKAIDEFNRAFREQGYLSLKQKEDLEKLNTDQQRLLARQNQRPKRTTAEVVNDAREDVNRVDNRLGARARRLLGEDGDSGLNRVTSLVQADFDPAGLGKAIDDAFSNAIKGTSFGEFRANNQALEDRQFARARAGIDDFKDGFDAFDIRFRAWQSRTMNGIDRAFGGVGRSDRQIEADATLRKSGEMVSPFGGTLSGESLTAYENAVARYRDAQVLANKLEDKGAFTGRNADNTGSETYVEFEKRRAAAIRDAAKATEELAAATRKASLEAVGIVSTRVFQEDLERRSTDIKGMLNVDLQGGRAVFDPKILDTLSGAASRVAELNKQISETTNATRLAQLNAERAGELAVAAAEAARADSAALFGSSNDLYAALSGDSAQDVGAMFAVDPAAFATFKTLADDLDEVNARLANVPANATDAAAQVNKLSAEARSLKDQLALLGPKSLSLESLNAKLQGLDVPEIDLSQYVYMPPSHIRNLNSSFTEVERATNAVQEALRRLGSDDASLQRYIGTLRDLQTTMRAAQIQAQAGRTQAVANAILDNGAGSVRAATEVAQIRGDNVTSGMLATESARRRYVGQAVLAEQGNLRFQMGGENAVSGLRQEELANAAIGNLNQPAGSSSSNANGTARTLSDVLGRLSEIGVAVDEINFTRLGAAARASLSSIGVDLDKIAAQIEKASPTANLTSLLARRAELFTRARDALLDTLYNTGAGLSEAFSRAGLGENDAVARLTASQAQSLMDLDRSAEEARLRREQVDNVGDYLEITQEIADIERERAAYLRTVNRTLEEQVGLINDVLGTSLDMSDVQFFGTGAVDQFTALAAGVQSEIDKINSGLASRLGSSVEEALGVLSQITRRGEVVTLFRDFETGMADALARGARTGFDRFKDLVEGVSFGAYQNIGRADRQRVTQETLSTETLNDLIDTGQLTRTMLDYIDQNYGSGDMSATDTVRGLQRMAPDLFSGLESLLATPTENLTTATDRSTAATIANTAAILNLPTPDGVTQLGEIVVNGSKGGDRVSLADNVGDEPNAATRTRLAGAGVQDDAVDIAMRAAGTFQEALRIAFAQLDLRIDPETFALADPGQLEDLDRLGAQFRLFNEDLAKAMRGATTTTGMGVGELQRAVIRSGEALEDLSDQIHDAAMAAVDAGRELSDSVRGDMNDAVKGLFKGELSLGEAGKSLLDGLTSSIVDTFVSGLMDPLTGEGGLLDRFLKGLGESIFGTFQTIGSGGKKGNLGEATSGLATMFGGGEKRKGGLLGTLTAPLGSVGEKFAGASSSLGAVVGDTMPALGDSISKNIPSLTSVMEGLGKSDGAGGGIGGLLGKAGDGLGSLLSGGGAGMWGALGGLVGSLFGGLFAEGGPIGGHGTGTSDSMIIGASKGEFMVNARATRRHYPLIKAINDGTFGGLPLFAQGGLVAADLIAPMPVSSLKASRQEPRQGGGNTTHISLGITGDISRQTKAEVLRMLPDIASGVNSVNREKGD